MIGPKPTKQFRVKFINYNGFLVSQALALFFSDQFGVRERDSCFLFMLFAFDNFCSRFLMIGTEKIT